jgi:hypothetical protein
VFADGVIVLRPLGIATSVTWMKPVEARNILRLVDEAVNRGFIMGSNLHAAFLVSPSLNGDFFKDAAGWEARCYRICKQNPVNKCVLQSVFNVHGDDQLARFETTMKNANSPERPKLQKLYCALIICEMMNEEELFVVAEKFGVQSRDVEELMEHASTNASQLQGFLELLGGKGVLFI